MKALFLIADGFEDLQFFCPYYRLREDGVAVTIASAVDNHAATGLHGYIVEPDMPVPELNPSEYDILVIPGGRAPEKLRLREEAVDVARTFVQDGNLVAAVGHGAQLLISAGALDGKSVTCDPGIRDDIRSAAGSYRDEGVVVDGPLITARGNDELPEFCEQIIYALGAKAR
ncbi:MAG TPA: DJ-1/PfpI/YhbO family deglycase/protease [Gemmataceae bacterium]|nr:DJ-1/PfpI/YhbO family deglycase/protease [Gemmataceae bacterium]